MTVYKRYIPKEQDVSSELNNRYQEVLLLKAENQILYLRYSDDQPRDEHGRWTSDGSGSGAGLTGGGDSGTMDSEQLHCYGDYLRDELGSALKNNPEEVEQIIKDVTEKGGQIIFISGSQKMVCNVKLGEPATIEVDENISIGGLRHEYRHFLDDMENGNPGLGFYLRDRDIFFEYEKRGYEEELKIACEYGLKDAENKILIEIERRRREIYGGQ